MFYIHISLNFKTTSRGRYDHTHLPVNDSSNKSIAQDLTAGKVQNQILLLYCFPKETTGPFHFKDFIANHHDETGREEHLQQVWGVTKSSLIKSLSETRGEGGATIGKKIIPEILVASLLPTSVSAMPSFLPHHNPVHNPSLNVPHSPTQGTEVGLGQGNLHFSCSAHSRLNPCWPVSAFLGCLFSIQDYFVMSSLFKVGRCANIGIWRGKLSLAGPWTPLAMGWLRALLLEAPPWPFLLSGQHTGLANHTLNQRDQGLWRHLDSITSQLHSLWQISGTQFHQLAKGYSSILSTWKSQGEDDIGWSSSVWCFTNSDDENHPDAYWCTDFQGSSLEVWIWWD